VPSGWSGGGRPSEPAGGFSEEVERSTQKKKGRKDVHDSDTKEGLGPVERARLRRDQETLKVNLS